MAVVLTGVRTLRVQSVLWKFTSARVVAGAERAALDLEFIGMVLLLAGGFAAITFLARCAVNPQYLASNYYSTVAGCVIIGKYQRPEILMFITLSTSDQKVKHIRCTVLE
ncbi:hypothetical protein HOY80DRAFT_950725 [Tuber brumale]|nr:hypothetical protein HOY80DRAFT_950725 [Tuber brumale]